MRKLYLYLEKSSIAFQKVLLLICLIIIQFSMIGHVNAALRRPVSTNSPMWIVHIDTWNNPDPQKIINLIPDDIKPYVVFNISLSISHDTNGRFKIAEYGYEIAKSWLRTCAENQVWAMVQVASGGMTQSQFSDKNLSVFEEFFQNYPNFIGFNYAEQFWGFDQTDPISVKWTDRINHFADLLKLSNKYGGYLTVSWCGNQYSQQYNPIAMLKINTFFAEACRKYTANYILCEKYTNVSYKFDMESLCLGAWLSGYSGHYGIRYDNSGWTDASGSNTNFTLASGIAPHLEHSMLTGQTVIDGPEIIWQNCFKESSTTTTSDGFTKRKWVTFAHFNNVMVDMFRKILDGTVRIPNRKEVIDRTKLVIVNDVSSGSKDSIYSTPKTLFDGLYKMDGDGSYDLNKSFFKKTGRYPTIPTVYKLNDEEANTFNLKINKSTFSDRWRGSSAKVYELNNYYPQEYSGDLYAGRLENGWVIYNPYKTDQVANATIPFKYNTCTSMQLSFSRYSAGAVKEYADKVTFYLNNYDDEVITGLKVDTIQIVGSSSEPSWSFIDRGNHTASVIAKSWSNGMLKLTVSHNGALDITINCSGSATGRSTSYSVANIIEPPKPAPYTGVRQYEAECFDRKNIASVVSNGYSGAIRNYTGQGYLIIGTNSAAAVRDTIIVLKAGTYKLQIRYSTLGIVNSLDLYINNNNVATPIFNATVSESNWATFSQNINLNAGANSIVLKANSAGTYNINLDNITVAPTSDARVYDFSTDLATTTASTPPAQFIIIQSGTAGVISYTNTNNQVSNCLRTYTSGSTNTSGVADLDLFPANSTNYTVIWKEYFDAANGQKGFLLRGNGNCPFAVGMKQGYLFTTLNNEDKSVTLKPYVATANGISKLQDYTSTFKVVVGSPTWYRASVTDSIITFECSVDSIHWEGASSTKITDNTFQARGTQLIWGLNSNVYNWAMDNITFKAGVISTNTDLLTGVSYTLSTGTGLLKKVAVSGYDLVDDIEVTASDNFEISSDTLAGFSSKLLLKRNVDSLSLTQLFVRLRNGLSANTYSGNIFLASKGAMGQNISLAGSVYNKSIRFIDYYTLLGQRFFYFDIDQHSLFCQNHYDFNLNRVKNYDFLRRNCFYIQKIHYTDDTIQTSKIRITNR